MPSCLVTFADAMDCHGGAGGEIHKVVVPDFPSWKPETYLDETFTDPGSELLIPMPNKPYICCCPVIQPDGPFGEIEEDWHTEECLLRWEIWESYMGNAPFMCDRCGELEHEGFRCDWGSDAGVVEPSWDSGRLEPCEFASGYGEILPLRSEPDPDGCLGLGCQRGHCSICKESKEYWTFCSSTQCPLGEDRPIRWSSASYNESGDPFCRGCVETNSVDFPVCVRCLNIGRKVFIFAQHKDGSGFVCVGCCRGTNHCHEEFSGPESTLVRVIRCGNGGIRDCPYDSLVNASTACLDKHEKRMCDQCAIDEEIG